MTKRMPLVASSGERPGTELNVLQSMRWTTPTAKRFPAPDGKSARAEKPGCWPLAGMRCQKHAEPGRMRGFASLKNLKGTVAREMAELISAY